MWIELTKRHATKPIVRNTWTTTTSLHAVYSHETLADNNEEEIEKIDKNKIDKKGIETLTQSLEHVKESCNVEAIIVGALEKSCMK